MGTELQRIGILDSRPRRLRHDLADQIRMDYASALVNLAVSLGVAKPEYAMGMRVVQYSGKTYLVNEPAMHLSNPFSQDTINPPGWPGSYVAYLDQLDHAHWSAQLIPAIKIDPLRVAVA